MPHIQGGMDPSIHNALSHVVLCFGNDATILQRTTFDNHVFKGAFRFARTWKCELRIGKFVIVTKQRHGTLPQVVAIEIQCPPMQIPPPM